MLCNSRDGLKTYSCYISCGLIESRSPTFSSLTLLHALPSLFLCSLLSLVFFILLKKTKSVGTRPDCKVNRKKMPTYVYVCVYISLTAFFTYAKPTRPTFEGASCWASMGCVGPAGDHLSQKSDYPESPWLGASPSGDGHFLNAQVIGG